jgi:hypothetical protein
VRAPLADVAALDRNGQACSALPPGALSGKIALIFRGVCFFEDKLNNAQAAGALGAVVFTDEVRPDPIRMGVGSATLPAGMVAYADGVALRALLERQPGLVVTLDFSLRAFPAPRTGIASFSGSGPSVDTGIKPDLVAVGTDLLTAAERTVPEGDLYAENGYLLVDGTSFSAPLAAGAAALLKAARPGLTSPQYRSLLVNGAASAGNAGVQQTGAGVMDVLAAVRSRISVEPVSVSFGAGGGTLDASRTLHVANLAGAEAALDLSVVPRGDVPAPELSVTRLTVDPGQGADVELRFRAAGLDPGPYEGYVRLSDPDTGIETRIPYWRGVGPAAAARIVLLESRDSGNSGARLRDAIVFRVTDAAGIIVRDPQPVVTAAAGGGQVLAVASIDREIPGAWTVNVQLGAQAGANQFRIEAGGVEKTVTITGR